MVGYSDTCFSVNPIGAFFGQQYLWKESVNVLDVLRKYSHQQNETSDSASFSAVRQGMHCHDLASQSQPEFCFIPSFSLSVIATIFE